MEKDIPWMALFTMPTVTANSPSFSPIRFSQPPSRRIQFGALRSQGGHGQNYFWLNDYKVPNGVRPMGVDTIHTVRKIIPLKLKRLGSTRSIEIKRFGRRFKGESFDLQEPMRNFRSSRSPNQLPAPDQKQ